MSDHDTMQDAGEPEVMELETEEDRERMFGPLRDLPSRIVGDPNVPEGFIEMEIIVRTHPNSVERIAATIASAIGVPVEAVDDALKRGI